MFNEITQELTRCADEEMLIGCTSMLKPMNHGNHMMAYIVVFDLAEWSPGLSQFAVFQRRVSDAIDFGEAGRLQMEP
jgi:hypothetical protein